MRIRALTLRARLLLYLATVHVLFAGGAAIVLFERPVLLFAAEAVFVLSVVVSVRLVRAFFVPLDLIRTGAELIAERDFTTRFVPVGQPEMDTLIEVYNRMIDRLREERLAARERHELLARIVEASPTGVVIFDFDGAVERMNPAAERIMTAELLAQMETTKAGEARLVPHAGARRLRVSRVAFRDRGFEKSVCLVEEMTEELRLAEKASYEKLIRMMSHEVNNSVGAVRSLLESAVRYAPQVGEADRADFVLALTIASARVDALNRFMTAFADVVRIPPPRRSRSGVAEIIERVAALLRPEMTEREIRVHLDLEDRTELEIDAAQIEQVVLNVFRNAIEAVGREGEIRASMRDGTLAIADSGPGIAPAARADLFTPFFTTKRDGRGLGLTIVQEILASHGLPFSLSNHEKGGAEFRIVFREHRESRQ